MFNSTTGRLHITYASHGIVSPRYTSFAAFVARSVAFVEQEKNRRRLPAFACDTHLVTPPFVNVQILSEGLNEVQGIDFWDALQQDYRSLRPPSFTATP